MCICLVQLQFIFVVIKRTHVNIVTLYTIIVNNVQPNYYYEVYIVTLYTPRAHAIIEISITHVVMPFKLHKCDCEQTLYIEIMQPGKLS